MSDWIKSQLHSLTNDQLDALVKDVERRIGSHVAGGQEDKHYVAKQRSILDAVQGEWERRKNGGPFLPSLGGIDEQI
ncbi:hypothetical protein ACE106_15220 [Shouchella clausii]|uniref:hypothetical protein n=1 Tax=Shouchella clausii TaxID=79880 RepID=UPI00289B6F56|nr:hypothetical protein [Shouchella clausii]